MTVKQAAAHAGVCESIVRKWLAAGVLPHFRIGAPQKRGKILISVADLDALITSFKVVKQQPEPKAAPVQNHKSGFRHLRIT